MRTVVWSADARADYLDIIRYISADDPDAATRVARAVKTAGDGLADFATGHPGRVAGSYEKSVRSYPYIIAYALADGDRTVSILRVIHTARDWPGEVWPE